MKTKQFLQTENIEYYLTKNGLMKWDHFENYKVIISEKISRNLSFTFKSPKGNFFLKQSLGNNLATREPFIREALFYKLITKVDLKNYVSRLHYFDKENDILVLQYLKDYNEVIYSENPLISIAKAIKKIHSISFKARGDYHYPWPLQLNLSFGLDWLKISKSKKKVIEKVFTDDEITNRISYIKAEYKLNSIIHGDLKSSNIMFNQQKNDIKLIDFESVSVGDSLWDLACVIIDYCFYNGLFLIERSGELFYSLLNCLKFNQKEIDVFLKQYYVEEDIESFNQRMNAYLPLVCFQKIIEDESYDQLNHEKLIYSLKKLLLEPKIKFEIY